MNEVFKSSLELITGATVTLSTTEGLNTYTAERVVDGKIVSAVVEIDAATVDASAQAHVIASIAAQMSSQFEAATSATQDEVK